MTIAADVHEVFIAVIPDFPTVYTNGDTPVAALANAYEAIALALEWYEQQGQPAPVPSAVAQAV
ncbi:MAG: type II toxin-antitoxin system HicB family antitoxin [Armatimonadetes bacterium]|nr:type II toxin-antitoxin system HicB family antitoxin [Armatimonadota bacterium]